MSRSIVLGVSLAMLASLGAFACGDDGDGESPGGGGASSGGAAGSSGAPSGGGTGGSTGGGSGSGGTGGSSGSGGAAGSGGSGAAPSYDTQESNRKSCKFTSGSKTTETIGAKVPHGDAMPFEHIVVLMQENRSFDHYFSELANYGVKDVDVPAANASNIDPDANPPKPVQRFHESRYCVEDVAHDWDQVHWQYDEGKMDGFVATNNPGGARAMGYYDQTDLPYYYWLAKTFSMSDRHFCSLLGPTWPNRLYFYGGTSWGNIKTSDVGFLTNNVYQSSDKLLDTMDKAGRSWKIYRDGITSFAVIFGVKYLGVNIAQFDNDVDADKLPALSIIDPSFSGASQNDEHPPANIQKGQQFAARVLNKLMSKPKVWQKTVFILLYDEHGGFYDHVPPPEACEPDGILPPTYKFDRLGVRTPFVIAAPWVKKGYVSHFTTDITSVTRFIQNRFDLPAMTARDANAWPFLDMFDFDNPPFMTPPTGAPSATPSQAGIDWCKNNPPGTGKP